jgi:hypothetical protein
VSDLTLVQSKFVKAHCNHRIRFGMPKYQVRLDRARTLHAFQPQQIFGYIRWQANTFGTTDWRLYVCKTCEPGKITRIPGISPGAEVLLNVHGTEAMKYILRQLDSLEKKVGGALEIVPESHWRQMQLAVRIARPIRKYSKILEV